MAVAAKKVMLLPPELVQTLQKKEQMQTAPLTRVKLQLDVEMENILNSDLPSDEKLKLYNETLLKFRNIDHPNASIPAETRELPVLETTSVEKPGRVHNVERVPMPNGGSTASFDDIDKMAAQFPVRLRSNAKQMLTNLGGLGKGWNEKGEWLTNSTAVRDTNILELVNYIIRVKPPSLKPTGLSEFMSHLPTKWESYS